MSQDSKSSKLIPFRLTRENYFVFVIAVGTLVCLVYIVLPVQISKALIKLGNTEFSAGNNSFGTASYTLALTFNGDLKESVDQCYTYGAQKQYELAISSCNKVIEIDSNW